jgi:biotin transport system substrate-specific component
MRSLAHRSLSHKEAAVGKFFGVAAFVVLLSFAALVKIPLPFTPVPVTMQNFVVFVGAAFLGPGAALAGVLSYIGLGVAGVPVFSGWGAGAAYLFGPTGGYLAGFLLSAWTIATLRPRNVARSFSMDVLIMAIGAALIYACGGAWLHFFYGWEWQRVWFLGVAPFVASDAVKIACAAALTRKLSR